MSMLKVENVHKRFGQTEILKGISREVNQGDVVCIIGPSGSGKTTFLRCINFLEKTDQGTMDFDQLHINLANVSKQTIRQVRLHTGFVFQNYNLFLNKTALENVTEGLIIARNVPKQEALAIAKQALDKVGLSGRYDYYPQQLSGGQQQRTNSFKKRIQNGSRIYYCLESEYAARSCCQPIRLE